MSRKHRIITWSAGLLCLTIGSIAWWWQGDLRSSPPSSPTIARSFSTRPDPPVRPPIAAFEKPPIRPAIYLLPETAVISRPLNSAETSPTEDLEIIDLLITIFRKANHGLNPGGGLNDEIAGALAGKNLNGFAVLPPNHPAFAKNGELLDRWGSPYYFHPLSSQQIDLRSAGPDGALWTADDIFIEGDNG